MSAMGNYTANELSERMTFDIMMSPPGYSRRQATFGLDGRVNLKSANNGLCMFNFMNIYIYIYMYTYIHTYIHTLHTCTTYTHAHIHI